jgi:hypothetical protein
MAMDGVSASVLTPFEAESYVEQLEIFDMKSIGNAKWLQQHEFLEKLNVQVHDSLFRTLHFRSSNQNITTMHHVLLFAIK